MTTRTVFEARWSSTTARYRVWRGHIGTDTSSLESDQTYRSLPRAIRAANRWLKRGWDVRVTDEEAGE